VLLALRDALARNRDSPIRLDELARQLGTEPAALAALLDHPATRTLVGLPAGALVRPDECGPGGCGAATPACRHCPAAVVPPAGTAPASTPPAAPTRVSLFRARV
jgi:hypothetical protein